MLTSQNNFNPGWEHSKSFTRGAVQQHSSTASQAHTVLVCPCPCWNVSLNAFMKSSRCKSQHRSKELGERTTKVTALGEAAFWARASFLLFRHFSCRRCAATQLVNGAKVKSRNQNIFVGFEGEVNGVVRDRKYWDKWMFCNLITCSTKVVAV